jgi:SPASM domain peptide maturase of grasp-with-spasm system
MEIVAAYCKTTRGAKRTLVMDFLTSKWWAFPNEIGELCVTEKIPQLKSKYEQVYELLKKENLILTIPDNDFHNFIPISNKYYFQGYIQNAIIDFYNSDYDLEKALFQLENLGCQNICFRVFKTMDLKVFESIESSIKRSTIESCEIYLSYGFFIDNLAYFFDYLDRNHRIGTIILFDCPQKVNRQLIGNHKLICATKKLDSSNCCGEVSPLYFTASMGHFNLSEHFNNCLYKKIGIDIHGKIKNCPSFENDFGHVDSINLKTIIHSSEFQKVGKIKKEQVSVCKECEFRNICSDCRVKVVSDLYSRPYTCPYNPYDVTWRGQENYITPENRQK